MTQLAITARNNKNLFSNYYLELQAEFNTLVGKLSPLLKIIEATDGLIDAIVYKLYGLTEEEIKNTLIGEGDL